MKWGLCLFVSVTAFGDLLVYTARPTTLQERILLSGPVEPQVSAVVKTKWFSLIKRIGAKPGAAIRKGDVIAEVETQYYTFRRQYLAERRKLLATQFDQVRFEEKLLLSRQEKLRGLAAKRIISEKEGEEMQAKTIAVRVKRLQLEKDLRELDRLRAETEEQIKSAGYYAPIDGIVTELAVDPRQLMGAIVMGGDSKLARIDQPGRYEVVAVATDVQAANVDEGQQARVFLDGWDKDFAARVVAVSQIEDEEKQKGLFRVKVAFETKGHDLKRGILSRVEIPIGKKLKQISVPWNAVRLSDRNASVLIDNPDGSVSERAVILGVRGTHRVGIESGLKEGEKVVAELW